MDGPLKIVQSQNGSLRDIHGRPMIMVYDSNKNMSQTSSNDDEIVNTSQSLTFISNTPMTTKESKKIRTLIRSHVMRKYKREEKETRPPKTESRARARNVLIIPASNSEHVIRPYVKKTQSVPLLPFPCLHPGGSLAPFVIYPILMKPHMYKLVHHYLTVLVNRIYPKEPYMFLDAISDAGLFHLLLCNSAVYLEIMSGRPESAEGIVHKSEMVRLLRYELENSTALRESSISIVAGLAVLECARNNHEEWAVHRNGLVRMVQLYGGFGMLSKGVQAKVCIAEMTGCIEDDAVPYFPFFDGTEVRGDCLVVDYPKWDLGGFGRLYSSASLDNQLVAILIELRDFSGLVASADCTKNVLKINHPAARLRHQLLSYRDRRDDSTEQQDYINEATRLSCLLYLETILHISPLRRDCSTLVKRLKVSISCVALGSVEGDTSLECLVVLWLCVICCIADAPGFGEGYDVKRLSMLVFILRLEDWEDLKMILQDFLWISERHDQPSKALWHQIVYLRKKEDRNAEAAQYTGN